MIRWVLVCLGMMNASLLATQMSVYNDSPFPLEVTIISATGRTMGTTNVYPQATIKWYDNFGENYSVSQTPYTVVFNCKHSGELFGVANNIPSGGLVTANSSTGKKYCTPPKHEKGEQQQGQPPPGRFETIENY